MEAPNAHSPQGSASLRGEIMTSTGPKTGDRAGNYPLFQHLYFHHEKEFCSLLKTSGVPADFDTMGFTTQYAEFDRDGGDWDMGIYDRAPTGRLARGETLMRKIARPIRNKLIRIRKKGGRLFFATLSEKLEMAHELRQEKDNYRYRIKQYYNGVSQTLKYRLLDNDYIETRCCFARFRTIGHRWKDPEESFWCYCKGTGDLFWKDGKMTRVLWDRGIKIKNQYTRVPQSVTQMAKRHNLVFKDAVKAIILFACKFYL